MAQEAQQTENINFTYRPIECPFSESNFGYQLWCCLATKNKDGSFVRCKRFASMRTKLTKRLQKIAISKRLPLFHNKEITHNFLCVFHSRMIIEERPFDDEFYNRDFLCYEENDLVDNRDFIPPPKRKRKVYVKIFGGDISSIETIYGSSDEEILAEDHEIIEGETSKAIDNKALDKNNKDAVIDSTNFSTLSAVAIRRYKKFFKLPNRSGANSKQQLLDGIEEHFKSLPIDIPETVAFFMHTVKSKRNKLDYPNEEFVHKKQLRSDM